MCLDTHASTLTETITLKPFPKQALVFMCLQYKPFENTAGKGEIAQKEQFLLFPQCFLSIWRTFCHFHQIQNCRPQILSVLKGLKFVVWERFNKYSKISLIRDRKGVTKLFELSRCSKYPKWT